MSRNDLHTIILLAEKLGESFRELYWIKLGLIDSYFLIRLEHRKYLFYHLHGKNNVLNKILHFLHNYDKKELCTLEKLKNNTIFSVLRFIDIDNLNFYLNNTKNLQNEGFAKIYLTDVRNFNIISIVKYKSISELLNRSFFFYILFEKETYFHKINPYLTNPEMEIISSLLYEKEWEEFHLFINNDPLNETNILFLGRKNDEIFWSRVLFLFNLLDSIKYFITEYSDKLDKLEKSDNFSEYSKKTGINEIINHIDSNDMIDHIDSNDMIDTVFETNYHKYKKFMIYDNQGVNKSVLSCIPKNQELKESMLFFDQKITKKDFNILDLVNNFDFFCYNNITKEINKMLKDNEWAEFHIVKINTEDNPSKNKSIIIFGRKKNNKNFFAIKFKNEKIINREDLMYYLQNNNPVFEYSLENFTVLIFEYYSIDQIGKKICKSCLYCATDDIYTHLFQENDNFYYITKQNDANDQIIRSSISFCKDKNYLRESLLFIQEELFDKKKIVSVKKEHRDNNNNNQIIIETTGPNNINKIIINFDGKNK